MKKIGLLTAACVFISLNYLFGREALINKPAFEEKSIQLSTGVKLEYVEQGNANGIPVIFLHGLSDSWHSFESTLPHLPASIHVFAISQRGHGNSERPSEGYSSKHFADDIAAFIEQKKFGAVIIVGHSMGGLNAQQFALNYPQLTKAVVIIDSDPSFKDNPGMPEFYSEVLKLEGAIDRKFMVDFQKATLARMIDSAYFNLLVEEGLKVPASVFKDAFKGVMESDFSNQLKEINRPVLIFWGDQDTFCGRKDQDILTNQIRNAKLIVYKGTGHALHWEQPERFAKDLLDFIQLQVI